MIASGQRGFTLLELLIGLSLLSLLTVALFGSVQFGTKAWQGAFAIDSGLDDIRAARAEIANAIEHAYPKLRNSDPVSSSIAFDGGPQRLTVLAPDPGRAGGMAYATLTLERAENGHADLVLYRTAELAPTAGKNVRTERLLHGVDQISFSYFGRDGGDGDPRWQNRWKDKMSPPQLVRVRARFADRRFVWPDMLVAPGIAADVSCVFDALSKTCQGEL